MIVRSAFVPAAMIMVVMIMVIVAVPVMVHMLVQATMRMTGMRVRMRIRMFAANVQMERQTTCQQQVGRESEGSCGSSNQSRHGRRVLCPSGDGQGDRPAFSCRTASCARADHRTRREPHSGSTRIAMTLGATDAPSVEVTQALMMG